MANLATGSASSQAHPPFHQGGGRCWSAGGGREQARFWELSGEAGPLCLGTTNKLFSAASRGEGLHPLPSLSPRGAAPAGAVALVAPATTHFSGHLRQRWLRQGFANTNASRRCQAAVFQPITTACGEGALWARNGSSWPVFFPVGSVSADDDAELWLLHVRVARVHWGRALWPVHETARDFAATSQ